MTDPNNFAALKSYDDDYDFDVHYDVDFEKEYDAGNPNLIYYRLFRFDPDNPDVLYSPVGTVAGNEEHFITNTFSRTGINVDTSGQGFFAASHPDDAAAWIGSRSDREGGYQYSKSDPFSYAVFPVIGVPHNYQYFQEHPEVFSDFGTAAGYIIDEMQIIGDPVYVWHSKNREEIMGRRSRNETWSNGRYMVEAIRDHEEDKYIQEMADYWHREPARKDEMIRDMEACLVNGAWEEGYNYVEDKIADGEDWYEKYRLIPATASNKQKARILIEKLKKLP